MARQPDACQSSRGEITMSTHHHTSHRNSSRDRPARLRPVSSGMRRSSSAMRTTTCSSCLHRDDHLPSAGWRGCRRMAGVVDRALFILPFLLLPPPNSGQLATRFEKTRHDSASSSGGDRDHGGGRDRLRRSTTLPLGAASPACADGLHKDPLFGPVTCSLSAAAY